MSGELDQEVSQILAQRCRRADLHYRPAAERHLPGKHLRLRVRGVLPAVEGEVLLRLDRFAGGGFAGQVYCATLLEIDRPELSSTGLKPGKTYAVKIHIPPTRFARRFRDALYWLGYQAPFSAQLDPDAARAGALWQKLVRRAAAVQFGSERCVADIHATFFDPEVGSFGEINEWVDGRVWRLEIDREIFDRHRKSLADVGASREYIVKREFMRRLVKLLHEMGAAELARQYEWWTGKSQPNVFKRQDGEGGAWDGLTALDFRPGLALLFCLPMSPVDFRLIPRGLARGSLVQFDRGDLGKLREFCSAHRDDFAGMEDLLEELETTDRRYRRSLPDITRQGLRLLGDGTLRGSVREGLISRWHRMNLVNGTGRRRLQESRGAFFLFYLTGVLPFLGERLRRFWGNPDYRRHLKACLGRPGYLQRTLQIRQAECLLHWHRRGRVGPGGAAFFLRHPLFHALVRVFPGMLPLPAKVHRALIDWRYALERAGAPFRFPLRFYRSAEFRNQWLNGQVEEGLRQGTLSPGEKEKILSQINDPFIQKYLKCLAVHFCTFPIGKIVLLAVGLYAYFNFGSSWQESMGFALAAMLILGVLPISPSSLVRGSYVVGLMIRERNVRKYWLAACVSFWRFIGYLGFPLQMVKEFPALARLIASRWVTGVVNVIPVFGEKGALLEHMVFDLCVNVPVSVRHRLRSTRLRQSSVEHP